LVVNNPETLRYPTKPFCDRCEFFLAYFAIKVFLHCSGEIKPLTAKDAKNFSKVRRENENRWLVPQSRLPVKEPRAKDFP